MFQKATKQASRLRLGICGASGGGKTYTGLAIATALGRTAVVDTEHGSAAKYSDVFEFDVVNLTSFEPQKFIDAINAAQRARYDVIMIDSLSHNWMGAGGVLEQVDEAKRRNPNGFTAWRDPSKAHTDLIEAILHADIHIIATMRSKMEYIMEESQGKKVPKKVGMAPIQRDGMEYEFDVVGDMQSGTFVVSKTRCPALADKSFYHPGAEFAGILREWLGGEPAPAPVVEPVSDHPADLNQRFQAACDAAGKSARDYAATITAHVGCAWPLVPAATIEACIASLQPQPTVTSQHPVWARLIDAAKQAGVNYTAVCAELMTAHNAVDASAVPIAAVEARIAELSTQQVAV
jgi:hypothetical protein